MRSPSRHLLLLRLLRSTVVICVAVLVLVQATTSVLAGVGDKYATLSLKDGRVLMDVRVTEVLADALKVAHRDGGGRILCGLLPDAVAKRYGFTDETAESAKEQDEMRKRENLKKLSQYDAEMKAGVVAKEEAGRKRIEAMIECRVKEREARRQEAIRLAEKEEERQRQEEAQKAYEATPEYQRKKAEEERLAAIARDDARREDDRREATRREEAACEDARREYARREEERRQEACRAEAAREEARRCEERCQEEYCRTQRRNSVCPSESTTTTTAKPSSEMTDYQREGAAKRASSVPSIKRR